MENDTRFEDRIDNRIDNRIDSAAGAADVDPASLDRVDTALIASDKVRGTAVYNAQNERLGSIDSIMIDKRSGEVAYVVMSFGGFLGIGERYHPLPWHVLTYDTEAGGYRVGLDRATLEQAPSFARNEVDSFDYDRDRYGIDSYYAPGDDLPTRTANRSDAGYGDANRSDAGYGDANRSDAGYGDANRSDANDGIERPLGYYSSQAQADRDNKVEGKASTTNAAAGGPGFYSPEQQAVRNSSAETLLVHADGSELATSKTDNDDVPTRSDTSNLAGDSSWEDRGHARPTDA